MSMKKLALAALTTLASGLALAAPGQAYAAVDCNSVAGMLALTVAPVVVSSTDVDDTQNSALQLDMRTQVFRVAQNPVPAACLARLGISLFVGRTAAEVATARTAALRGQRVVQVVQTATLKVLPATFVGTEPRNINLRNYRVTVPRNFAGAGTTVFYRWAKVIDNRDAVAQDIAWIHVFGPQSTFVATAPPAPPAPRPNLVPELVGAQRAFTAGGGSLGNATSTFIGVDDSFCALQGAALISEEAVNLQGLGAGTRYIVQPPALSWRLRNTAAVAVPAATVITSEVINTEGTTPNRVFTVNGIAANASRAMPLYERAAVEVWEFPVAGGEGNCFVQVESDGGNPFRECIRIEVDSEGTVVETSEGANNVLSFGCN